MHVDIIHHYPPELMELLIDTIPLLCRSKPDVLLFFRGAGVSQRLMSDLAERVRTHRKNIGKYESARVVLTRLNDKGETTLRQRREIVKRVVEFEDFSACWPSDQLKAQGLVSNVGKVVNVKDSFTRMRQERDKERQERIQVKQKEAEAARNRRGELAKLKRELFALFVEPDPHKRGKALEGALNRLFQASGMLVREAFTRSSGSGAGVVEQIDGVVEVDGNPYLVEMKWHKKPLGPDVLAQHLVRVFSRADVGAIFISESGYTPAGIEQCREALPSKTVVLATLQEIVRVLEEDKSLRDLLKHKIVAASVHKEPFHDPFAAGQL